MHTKVHFYAITLLLVSVMGACEGCSPTIQDAKSWELTWKAAQVSGMSTTMFKGDVFSVPEANKAYIFASKQRKLYEVTEKAPGVLEVKEAMKGVRFTHAFAIGKELYVVQKDHGNIAIGPLRNASKLSPQSLDSLFSRYEVALNNYAIETCGTVAVGGITRGVVVMKNNDGARVAIFYSVAQGVEPSLLPLPITAQGAVSGILSAPQKILVSACAAAGGVIVPLSVSKDDLLEAIEKNAVKTDPPILMENASPNALFWLTASELPQEKKVIVATYPKSGAPTFRYLTPAGKIEKATSLPEEAGKMTESLVVYLGKGVYVIGKNGPNSICYYGTFQKPINS